MTYYFDEAIREIKEKGGAQDGPGFLCVVELVEARVLRDVLVLVRDRQFPSDLRLRIEDAVELWRANVARVYVQTLRLSRLLPELHELFHMLAVRRIEVRWGVLDDDPGAMMKARENYDRRPGTGDGMSL